MSAASLHSRDVKTLGEAVRRLLAKRSPKILTTVLLAELLLRAVLGPLTWRDAVAAGALMLAYPFGEWAIHVHVLHLKPFTYRGRRVELGPAKGHREHHESPNNLSTVSLDAIEIALLLLVAVPVVVGVGALLAWPLIGEAPAAAPFVTGMATGTLLVGIYEWTHFLIHTSYRPRSRFYRAIWRGHRLHHFKNEHYWHGITTTIADNVFGTAPDQRDVSRSETARSLHTS